MAKKRRVAVMIDLEWPYRHHIDTFAGCQQYAAEAGWDCVIEPFADRALNTKGDRPYDGILARATLPLAKAARKAGIPVVNVWMHSPTKGLPSLFPDFGTVGAMAAEHLMGRGFRQFGYLGLTRDARRDQCDGFLGALKREGFPCTIHRFSNKAHIANANKWEAFVAGLGAWIETWTLPIGIHVHADLTCRYLIEACHSKGLHVPQDVAIVGTSNEVIICTSSPPTLTSIDLGFGLIGYRAAALLDRLMDGEPPPPEPVLLAPKELVPRQSTDSFSVDDPLVSQALRYIAEHSHKPMQVNNVAAAVAITRRSLERRFRKSLNHSIAEEITRLRLERAKRRLVETDDSMNVVAENSGFSDANHFYKAFLRVEDISPTKYREERSRHS